MRALFNFVGSKIDVVCARVGGANTTLISFMNFISAYFAKRNLNSGDFFKTESRSPRGFLPRPLLRAGESIAPPPLPQKNSGGAHHFRFRFLDLWIRFGKMISKVCEDFNSGATKLDTNSFFEDESVRSPSPANGGAGLRSATAPPSLWREMKRILMLSGEINFFFLRINNTNL